MRMFPCALLALVALSAHGQIKKKLAPETATRLGPGEVVRYFKTRPHEIENGLPYQVLIIVWPDHAIVKTNKWEFHMTLNGAQRQSLKEDLGYLDMEHLNMYKHEKGTPEEERGRLLMYLTAKKGKQTIRWNNKAYDARGQVLLIEALEVYHYFGRQEREKGGG